MEALRYMEKKSRKKTDLFNGFSLTKNIDKYGIINLIIWVSIPVIIAIIVYGNCDFGNANTSSSSSSSLSSTYFTNKYGTPTTKCKHSGCNRNIATSGDTNCCEVHSNKCQICSKYIDEDAQVCMECVEKTLKNKSK